MAVSSRFSGSVVLPMFFLCAGVARILTLQKFTVMPSLSRAAEESLSVPSTQCGMGSFIQNHHESRNIGLSYCRCLPDDNVPGRHPVTTSVPAPV